MQLSNVQAGPGALGVRTLVLTADKFEDLELLVPYFRLLEEGGVVDIASPTMEEISGEHGYRVMPDLLITNADPDEYGLLLVPGGFPDGAPATVCDIPEAQEIARSFFTSNKPVAAICHGPWLLAAAGVVEQDDDSPRIGKTAFPKTYALPVVSGRTPRWSSMGTSSRLAGHQISPCSPAR